MNTSIFIARRYLFAKKSHHIINIISMVSMIGIAIGTMGLIVVLSVFNGFGNLVVSLYDQFDPDIKITVVEGKTFYPKDAGIIKIKNIEGVITVAEVLEENALLKYRDKQFIGRIKGMSNEYGRLCGIKNKLLDGEFVLASDSINFAVLGSVVAYSLSINLSDPFYPLMVYLPKMGENVLLNPMDAFNSGAIYAAGVFAIQQDFDSKYMLVPLRFARDLTGEGEKVSALEILLKPECNSALVLKEIKKITGEKFLVRDRVAQHDFLYKILKSEKLAVFLILSLILLIATFSIIGTLTIFIIEKKKDIEILISMGAGKNLITRIFLTEGMLITAIGAISGITLGWIICFIQQYFGIIKLENAESFVIESYPVSMQVVDFLWVLLIVGSIGFLSSWYTSSKLIGRYKLI